MAFPLRTAEGADVGASESLSHPVLLARHSKSENLLSRVVFPDPASSALASAHRARHPRRRRRSILPDGGA
jgi:hypothetical protein